MLPDVQFIEFLNLVVMIVLKDIGIARGATFLRRNCYEIRKE